MKKLTRLIIGAGLALGILAFILFALEPFEEPFTKIGCGAIVTHDPVRLYTGTHSESHHLHQEFGPVTSYIETEDGLFFCVLNGVCVDSRDVRLDKVWLLPKGVEAADYFEEEHEQDVLRKTSQCQISDLSKE